MIKDRISVKFESGFVLNPDSYYSPTYRISPFNTSDVSKNKNFVRRNTILDNLDKRFEGRHWRFTTNGKEAIKFALEALGLESNQCVTIYTTSGNTYISGCVTAEIEKVCKWSRQIESNTAAIFVNHEFGYPYRDLSSLTKFGLPIIEDACHSYFSNTSSLDMGLIGDFTIFSLPKAYPVQIGGLLTSKQEYNLNEKYPVEQAVKDYLTSVMSNYLVEFDQAPYLRLRNYEILVEKFSEFECVPYFDRTEKDVPGVFLFKVPKHINLSDMKNYGWSHGIECSVFYGENAFFIPVHQRLTLEDLDYFYTVFAFFLRRYL
jgi:hypothetical protein